MSSEGFECYIESCERTFDTEHGRSLHFGKGHSKEVKRDALLTELHRVAEKLGQTPSVLLMQEHGKFGRDAYEGMFGSWSAALEAAELDPAPQYEHRNSELIEEMQRLADELGRQPRRNEMREFGGYTTCVYYQRFGSWNDALRECGFEPYEIHKIDRETLLEELLRLADDLGRTPSRNLMREKGKFDSKPYRRAFGSWNNALEEAGLEPIEIKGRPEEELLDEIRRLAEELGKTPTSTEMWQKGEFSVTLYRNRFGTWNDAIRAAGLEPNQTEGFIPALYGPGWTEKKREKVRSRDGYQCCTCGKTQLEHQRERGQKLHVHHIIPAREYSESDPRANATENLVTLCRFCHVEWEHAAGFAPIGEDLPEGCNPPDPDGLVTLADYCDSD